MLDMIADYHGGYKREDRGAVAGLQTTADGITTNLQESTSSAVAEAVTASKSAMDKSVVTAVASGVEMMQKPTRPTAQSRKKLRVKEFNDVITCNLCRGYLVNATSVDICEHSYCRSCIVKYLETESNCPDCKPQIRFITLSNLRSDELLCTLVYKIVPGLIQQERERQLQFWKSLDSTSDCDMVMMEEEFFYPAEPISLSLEYHPALLVSCNKSQIPPVRYLQCPAGVTVHHLKRFLCSKYDIDPDNQRVDIDIIYEDEILPEHFNLMDVGYCYHWKRVAPMRFCYRILLHSNIPVSPAMKSVEVGTSPSSGNNMLAERNQQMDSGNTEAKRVKKTPTDSEMMMAPAVPPKSVRFLEPAAKKVDKNGEVNRQVTYTVFKSKSLDSRDSSSGYNNNNNNEMEREKNESSGAMKMIIARKQSPKRSNSDESLYNAANDFKSLRSNDMRYSDYTVTSSITGSGATLTKKINEEVKPAVPKCDIVVSIPQSQINRSPNSSDESLENLSLAELKTAGKKTSPSSACSKKNVPKLKIELNNLRTKITTIHPKSAEIRREPRKNSKRKLSIDESVTDKLTYAKIIGLKPIDTVKLKDPLELPKPKTSPDASPMSTSSSTSSSTSNGTFSFSGNDGYSLTSSSSHKKRKKKHSKEPKDSNGKRRKLHAEISSQPADESLKMKVKITGSHNHRPHKIESRKLSSSSDDLIVTTPTTPKVLAPLPSTESSVVATVNVNGKQHAKKPKLEASPPSSTNQLPSPNNSNISSLCRTLSEESSKVGTATISRSNSEGIKKDVKSKESKLKEAKPKEFKCKDTKDLKESKDHKVSKDNKDHKDHKDHKESKAHKELKDHKESKDIKESKDHKEMKDHKDHKEVKDYKVSKDSKDLKKEFKDHKEPKEYKESKDIKDFKESKSKESKPKEVKPKEAKPKEAKAVPTPQVMTTIHTRIPSNPSQVSLTSSLKVPISKPLTSIQEMKLPASPPLPPSLFKTTPLTIPTITAATSTKAAPAPVKPVARNPATAPTPFPTGQSNRAPKLAISAAKPHFAVPQAPLKPMQSSPKLSPISSIASSAHKHAAQLKRSASLDGPHPTALLTKQQKIDQDRMIRKSAYGPMFHHHQRPTKPSSPSTPGNNKPQEKPFYTSSIASSYTHEMSKRKTLPMLMPPCSISVTKMTDGPNGKIASPSSSSAITITSQKKPYMSPSPSSSNQKPALEILRVPTTSTSEQKAPSAALKSSPPKATRPPPPPIPLVKIKKSTSQMTPTVRTPALTVSTKTTSGHSQASPPGLISMRSIIPAIVASKSAATSAENAPKQSEKPSSETNGKPAKEKSSTSKDRRPLSKDNSVEILDLSGKPSSHPTPLTPPTPAPGNSLEAALNKIKQNMTSSTVPDSISASANITVKIENTADDHLQNLHLLSESATNREKIAIKSLPKLNEISKVRSVQTPVRQQNASVRNIPNPSALAFRNQPQISSLSSITSKPQTPTSPTVESSKPEFKTPTPPHNSPSSSTNPGSPPRHKKNLNIEQVAANLNMRAAAAADKSEAMSTAAGSAVTSTSSTNAINVVSTSRQENILSKVSKPVVTTSSNVVSSTSSSLLSGGTVSSRETTVTPTPPKTSFKSIPSLVASSSSSSTVSAGTA